MLSQRQQRSPLQRQPPAEMLLVPAPPDLLVARPVSTAVNSTRNDGPDLIEPAEASD